MSEDPKELFDEVVREYIDFVNEQVGAYMSALAGFAGHHARVSRQVHRANRPVATKPADRDGMPTVVWASYEDPTKPDIIHNQIIRSDEYLEANRPGGRNEQQHSRAILIFLFTYWEAEIRPRLARAKGVAPNDIQSDIMGDLGTLRNVILHAKGVLRLDKHASLDSSATCSRPTKSSSSRTKGCTGFLYSLSRTALACYSGGWASKTGRLDRRRSRTWPSSSGHRVRESQSQMRPNIEWS